MKRSGERKKKEKKVWEKRGKESVCERVRERKKRKGEKEKECE